MNVCMVLALLVASQSRGPAAPLGAPVRTYELRRLPMSEALAILRRECWAKARNPCTWKLRGREFVVKTSPATHAKIAAALGEADVPGTEHVLEVTLLLATQGSAGSEDHRMGASEAVRKLLDGLPYEGFVLLASGDTKPRRGKALELMGEGGYQVEIELDAASPEEALLVERLTLRSREEGEPEKVATELRLRPGETVVALSEASAEGEGALVVLLTRKGAPGGEVSPK